jgi:hypothetical protein
LVLRAFGIRGRRDRRPMICFLSFKMAKDKGRPNSRRVPSITAKKRQRAPYLSWLAMRRFIKMVNHARPWALVARSYGAHPCFHDCTPSREQRHVSARGIMDDLRLVAGLRRAFLEISASTTGWCSANRGRLAAAHRPVRCGCPRFGGHRWWRSPLFPLASYSQPLLRGSIGDKT